MNWSEENSVVLREWMEKTSGLRWLHLESRKLYIQKTHMLSLPLLIMSTTIGMSSFATITMDKPTLFEYGLQIVFAIGNLMVAILSGILKYGGYAELAEQHRNAFIESSQLYRCIHIELSLPTDAREDYMTFCRKVQYSYDKLTNNPLDIPSCIIVSFNRVFPYCKNRPDIVSGLYDLDENCFQDEKRRSSYRYTHGIEESPPRTLTTNTEFDDEFIIDNDIRRSFDIEMLSPTCSRKNKNISIVFMSES